MSINREQADCIFYLFAPSCRVLYLCDTAVSPLDLYRTLAGGARAPAFAPPRASSGPTSSRRSSTCATSSHTTVVAVLDEAQHLADRFLVDLAGFLNFAFDSRDVLTLWLVGLPPLTRHLAMQQHAPLAMRVAAHVHLEPVAERPAFLAFIQHGLEAVGGSRSILADPAVELLWRTSRGLPRVAATILRAALRLAHERDQSFVDEHVLAAALDDVVVPVRP